MATLASVTHANSNTPYFAQSLPTYVNYEYPTGTAFNTGMTTICQFPISPVSTCSGVVGLNINFYGTSNPTGGLVGFFVSDAEQLSPTGELSYYDIYYTRLGGHDERNPEEDLRNQESMILHYAINKTTPGSLISTLYVIMNPDSSAIMTQASTCITAQQYIPTTVS